MSTCFITQKRNGEESSCSGPHRDARERTPDRAALLRNALERRGEQLQWAPSRCTGVRTRQNRTAVAPIQRWVGGRCNKKRSERTRPNSRNGHVVLSPLLIACLRLRQGKAEVEVEQQRAGPSAFLSNLVSNYLCFLVEGAIHSKGARAAAAPAPLGPRARL